MEQNRGQQANHGCAEDGSYLPHMVHFEMKGIIESLRTIEQWRRPTSLFIFIDILLSWTAFIDFNGPIRHHFLVSLASI